MIRIENKKTYRGEGVYIGRPSIFGNRFVIGKDGDRSEVIQKFRRWLWDEVKTRRGSVYAELLKLAEAARCGDLTLICWCHPEPCHGDVLKSCLEFLMKETTGSGQEALPTAGRRA